MQSRRLADSPWFVYLITLVSAAPLSALIAWSLPMPEGACSGLGWGCSLYGWDAAALVMMVLGIPYALVLAIVLGVLTLLGPQRRNAARTVAWIGFALPWIAVMLGVAGGNTIS